MAFGVDRSMVGVLDGEDNPMFLFRCSEMGSQPFLRKELGKSLAISLL